MQTCLRNGFATNAVHEEFLSAHSAQPPVAAGLLGDSVDEEEEDPDNDSLDFLPRLMNDEPRRDDANAALPHLMHNKSITHEEPVT